MCSLSSFWGTTTGRLLTPTTCLPHEDGGIPFSALPKNTTSKLTGLFSTVSLLCRAPSKEAMNTTFKNFLVWLNLGNKPQVYRLQSGHSNHYAIALVGVGGRCFLVVRFVSTPVLRTRMTDRNQICPNCKASTITDVLARPFKWQTPISGRGDVSKRIVNKFRRPVILQLNVKRLTANMMSVLYHLVAQGEAPVILLQETHYTSAQKLVLPDYQLTGFSLSRKHGLATFVHERLKWTLFDQSPPTSETE